MSDLQMGMVDPRGQIVRDCAGPKLPRKSIALTYAFAIRQERTQSFKAANEAIIAVYGVKGLDWIKNRAWAYVEGRITPGGPNDR